MKKIKNDTFIVPSMPKKIPCLFRCFFSHLIGDFAGYLVSFLMKVFSQLIRDVSLMHWEKTKFLAGINLTLCIFSIRYNRYHTNMIIPCKALQCPHLCQDLAWPRFQGGS